jgi:2-polyprenyl-6-methoxyphenol hydroxylase-like FAD-dependent oxidoreductase
MSGLFTARVLADHFSHVTVLERDDLPVAAQHRRGVPQGRHGHTLLVRGLAIAEELFPGLTSALVAQGALPADLQGDTRWYNEGHLLRQARSGLEVLLVSRPRLEAEVRRRVRATRNIRVRTGCQVIGLRSGEGTGGVRGVGVRTRAGLEMIDADLVVDATGRGSHSPAWLSELGYPPEEERVEVDLRYTTRHFRRYSEQLDGDLAAVVGNTDEVRRGGLLLAQEGDRWLVTLHGYLGEHAPLDLDGFTEYAATLVAPDIHDVIRSSEPLDDGVAIRFPASVRRHYGGHGRFPDGYLVVGDALCSFNPAYAQGMSVAAMEAMLLGECLVDGLDHLASRFFGRAAGLSDAMWGVVVGGDLRYPEVEGPRRDGDQAARAFMARVHLAASRDAEIGRAVVRLIGLIDGPEVFGDAELRARIDVAAAIAA